MTIAPGTVVRAVCPHCGVEVVQALTGISLWADGPPEIAWRMEHTVEGGRHTWDVRVGALVKLEAVEGCTVEGA